MQFDSTVPQKQFLTLFNSDSFPDSWGSSRSSDVRTWSDVRYLLLDQHSGCQIPRVVARAVRPDRWDDFETHCRRECDFGVRELTRTILRRVPGGLCLHVEIPRGIADLNRRRDYCGDGSQYFLRHFDRYIDVNIESGQTTWCWLQNWYRHARGWGNHVDARYRQGLLDHVDSMMPTHTPVWDIHTYDFAGIDGVRPLIQVLQHLGNEGRRPSDRMMSNEMLDALRLQAISFARTVCPSGLSEETVFSVDAPYRWFHGCTVEHFARRQVMITEFRKDLLVKQRYPVSQSQASSSILDLAVLFLQELLLASRRNDREDDGLGGGARCRFAKGPQLLDALYAW